LGIGNPHAGPRAAAGAGACYISIAAETDILDITRTWQFQRNNPLGWGNRGA